MYDIVAVKASSIILAMFLFILLPLYFCSFEMQYIA